jgi:hypothetical protein
LPPADLTVSQAIAQLERRLGQLEARFDRLEQILSQIPAQLKMK